MPIPSRQTCERDVERYLVEQTAKRGGETRKVQWIGRHGAPDRMVMLPGRAIWVELKAPGEKAKPHQLREHARMRALGQHVVVIDSFDGVDELLRAHLVLANIERYLTERVAEAGPPKLAGPCSNCGRDVYVGSAFFYGRGVYCTTLGCTSAAHLLEEKP